MNTDKQNEWTIDRKPFSWVSSQIAGFLLWCIGWHVEGPVPQGERFVAIAAPHRSNWDLVVALLTAIKIRIPVVFMMKKSMFWWPLSLLWHRLGGLPIDRSQRKQIVPNMVEAMKRAKRMALVITPEGTRKNVQRWKTGFYWIAWGARVPVLLLWIGHENKAAGLGEFMDLTGDIQADFQRIRAWYEAKLGRPMPHITPGDQIAPPEGVQ